MSKREMFLGKLELSLKALRDGGHGDVGASFFTVMGMLDAAHTLGGISTAEFNRLRDLALCAEYEADKGDDEAPSIFSSRILWCKKYQRQAQE